MVSCHGRSKVEGNALCQPGLCFSRYILLALSIFFFNLLLAIYVFQALLSGCSAGGLASILHCDEFRELLPRNTKVKCLGDAGLFLDAYGPSCELYLKKIMFDLFFLLASFRWQILF